MFRFFVCFWGGGIGGRIIIYLYFCVFFFVALPGICGRLPERVFVCVYFCTRDEKTRRYSVRSVGGVVRKKGRGGGAPAASVREVWWEDHVYSRLACGRSRAVDVDGALGVGVFGGWGGWILLKIAFGYVRVSVGSGVVCDVCSAGWLTGGGGYFWCFVLRVGRVVGWLGGVRDV